MPASPPPRSPRADDLRSRLTDLIAQGQVTIADEHRLLRRIDRPTGRGRRRAGSQVEGIDAELDAAVARLERRVAARPEQISYPGELPVSAELDRLGAAISGHQVVVVAGATGSGKTTQLPKLCLDLGRGIRGMVGHTQPRRIAARTVADRIAEELGCELGTTVGYQVRFTDRTRDDTLIKVMTDGVLLAEAGRDPDLLRYDTVIVDEAHERSLNIDFLLGYLHRLLPRRPDLKLLITSATIDPQAFADHFGGAPVVEVSGRTYPVEIRYRPRVADVESEDEEETSRPSPPPSGRAPEDSADQVTAICDAIGELINEPRGDILVFCSGEREIRDTAAAVKDLALPGTEILPLYSRLSAAEQHRVFSRHSLRRIVLSTNVAETSVTVPGIKYVVDPGTARISRYSRRLKVQRLPIEPVSQASADQRAGRCGRQSDGIFIRLYSEADYEGRPRFTDPEILRTSLASVILQMAALRLGRLGDFPFLDPPDSRAVTDGERLLEELGALGKPSQHGNTLTPIGRQLADLPLDPRLARMVVAADGLGVLREALVIVAGLTIADPRERPSERQQAADTAHKRFRLGSAADSDFVGWLHLWDYIRGQQKALSSSAFRRMCSREFLHFLRIREWQDLESQLRSACRQIGLTPSGPVRADVDPELIHRALLPGLLSHVGLRDERRRQYDGARGATFWISPGSSLFRRQPDWVMAAELVETTRLWARTVAGVDPAWIEEAGDHLLRRSYSEPHWEARQGQVVAIERATLYGLPVVTDRKVPYGRIDPEVARELFIRRALVEGDWDTRHAFVRRNAEAVAEVERLEEKARRRDLLVDDEVVFAHYDQRIPADVTSAAHFDAWWRKAGKRAPHLLDLTPDQLIRSDAERVSDQEFPSQIESGGLTYNLSYAFDPGASRDGVTADIDVSMLNQLAPQTLSWEVPGLRAELLTALIRSLPKNLRRLFVPAPDTATRLLTDGFDPDSDRVVEELARALTRRSGTPVSVDDFDITSLPEHLRVTYRVSGNGRTLATGKDVTALQRDLRQHMRSSLADAATGLEQTGLTSWSFGELPDEVEIPARRNRPAVVGYPALVDEKNSVAVRVLESREAQRDSGWAGQRRLVLLNIPSPVRAVLGSLDNATKLALGTSGYPSASALFDDAMLAAVDDLMHRHGAPVRTGAAFDSLCTAIRSDLVSTLTQVLRDVAEINSRAEGLRGRLDHSARAASPVLAPSIADMQRQLTELVSVGFVGRTGLRRLGDLRRYLRGLEIRLERLPGSGGRDLVKLETLLPLQRDFDALLASVPAGRPVPSQVADIRWMLQELRISLFAQTLRTPQPVSEKRVRTALAAGRTAVQALTRPL
jgi:ATP-dependent helicase HrpA